MKTTALFSLVLATTAAACGDDGGSINPDAPIAQDAPEDSNEPAHVRAVVVTGDYTPGNPGALAVVDVTARTLLPLSAPQGAVTEDPILRHEDGELFVVNRSAGNNVTILDAGTLALVEQLGTGAGSNPQDVAVVGNKLVVATYGNKGAVVLERGSSTVTEIDLSADDPDGVPNCASIYKVGAKLYVACQLLDDSYTPRGPGKVYVLDATTFAKTATLTLTTNNPFTLFEQVPTGAPHAGDLLLPTIDFGTGEGCVERITTGATPAAAGCLVDNSVFGNYPSRISVGGTTLYSAVSPAADFTMSALKLYDLATDTLSSTTTPPAQVIADVVACPSGEIVVSDKSTATAGLRIYSADGATELTTAPLTVALKPQSQHGLVCY